MSNKLKRWREYTVYIFPTPQTSQTVPRLRFNATMTSKDEWREIEDQHIKVIMDKNWSTPQSPQRMERGLFDE